MKPALFREVFSLGLLKKVIFAVIILSFVYIISSVVSFKNDYFFERKLVKNISFLGKPDEIKGFKDKEKEDYALFLRQLEKNNIFAAVYPKKIQIEEKISRKDLEDIIGSLKLVGIVELGSQKVIIEDKRKNAVFYLKEEDNFLDDIAVKKVRKDSVILYYQGQEFELYL
ncbi:MAG: hypothetical protein JW734_09735 [Candidatus Omnitrophica bacterium]|nr:hypothetical protein [Candidatus Omnitrophota bacterium]